jgi:AraC-like DNA-binding protein
MEELLIKADHYQSFVHSKDGSSKVVRRCHRHPRPGLQVDVHGAYWSLGLFDFPAGAGLLQVAGKTLALEGLKLLFVPPFSVLHWKVFQSEINWTYLIVNQGLNPRHFSGPRLWCPEDLGLVEKDFWRITNEEILQRIEGALKTGESAALAAHHCSQRFKNIIDGTFRESGKIQELGEKIGGNYSYLSRLFKRDFGLSPIQYRNQLRMIQASVDLLFEAPTVEVAKLKSGIEDSSYFYESFRKCLLAYPSDFRNSNCFGHLHPSNGHVR